jgi:hypothetical protein
MPRKKSEGIEALVQKHEPAPLSELTMLDLFACFALMNMPNNVPIKKVAVEAFDIAEEMMAERDKRL